LEKAITYVKDKCQQSIIRSCSYLVQVHKHARFIKRIYNVRMQEIYLYQEDDYMLNERPRFALVAVAPMSVPNQKPILRWRRSKERHTGC